MPVKVCTLIRSRLSDTSGEPAKRAKCSKWQPDGEEALKRAWVRRSLLGAIVWVDQLPVCTVYVGRP